MLSIAIQTALENRIIAHCVEQYVLKQPPSAFPVLAVAVANGLRVGPSLSILTVFGGENGFGRGRSLQQNHRIRDHPETETGDLAVPRTAAGEEPPSIHSEGEQTATQWQPDRS